MDDLNDLIWGSGSNKSPNQKNNNTSLNAMRGTTTTLPKKSTTLSTPSTTIPNSSNQNIFHSQAINANSPVFKRFNNNNNSDLNPSANNQNFSSPSTDEKNIYSSDSSNNRSPNLSPSSNNDSAESLDNLFLPFTRKVTNLSLTEKRKLQEQEQQRKLQEEHEKLKEHYGQSHFWDSLERRGLNSSDNNGSESKIRGSSRQTGDIFDDILSGANQYGTSESISQNSLNNQMKSQNSSKSKPSSKENQWDLGFLSNETNGDKTQNTISSSTTDDLMDFGIFKKQNKSSSSLVPTLDEDDENPLGELARPVSSTRDTSPHSEKDLSSSPKSRNESKDHLIAKIVDMGFSVDDAEAALAATDDGEDVSSAIEILFQQCEAVDNMSRNKTSKQQHDLDRRKSNTADTANYSHREDDDDSEHGYTGIGRFLSKNHSLNVPKRNVYGRNISDGESSDRSSSSVSSNFLQQKEKLISTASELGMNAFKKASAFYKQSKEVVNKALEDLQQPDSEEDNSGKPRWMQDSGDFQSGYDDFPDNKFERFEERFQDSYDDSSSDDDYHHSSGRNRFVSVSSKAKDSSEDELPTPNRNKFIPISSKLRDSSDDDILTGRNKLSSKLKENKENNDDRYRSLNRNDSKKPPKPIVPSRSTKPNMDSLDSTYISPARRQFNNSQKPVITNPKPKRPPRTVVHVSSEHLSNSETHKTKGNELFKIGQFGEAEKFYSLAIDSLPHKHLLRAILYNNRAAARLKNGDHRGCTEDCTLILQLIDDYTLPPPPEVTINLKDQYIKALLRRASAYETMEKYDCAKDDYQKLISIDPSIAKSVSDGLRRCQKAIKMMTGGGKPEEIKEENNSPLISSNQPSNQHNFNEFMFSGTSTSASQSTFGTPLNAFGFIDPLASTSTSSTFVDPNNPAVARLRDQARQQELEDAEKFRLKDQVDQKITRWKGGKETNIRALISSLDIILWDGIGWKTIGLHELVTPSQVKVRYMKAISKLHPDKLNSTTTIEQRLLANGVFSALNDAWDAFKIQNNL